MAAVHDNFGPPPASLPPSTLVRRWDTALVAGCAAFSGVLMGVGWAFWHPLPGSPIVPDGGLVHQLLHYPSLLKWSLTPGAPVTIWADNPASYQFSSPLPLHVRLLPAWLAAAAAGSWATVAALKPHSLTGHVAGPRVLEGKEAVAAARQISMQALDGQPGWVKLHPALDLPKRHWTSHTLIYGGVGAGKTQVITSILAQVLPRRMKAFILDTKGDYTSKFGSACILSPWHRNSRYWDIAADIDTAPKADGFAAAIIPRTPGPNEYFSVGPQMILAGCIRALIAGKPRKWTWLDLHTLISLPGPTLRDVLAEHFPKAATLLSGAEQTVGQLMSSLAAHTATISQLAEAWGDGTRSNGKPRKRLSLSEWARDGYAGRPAIIAQAGPDPALTQRYLAAAINVIATEIINPAFPDDVSEDGRAIWLVIDELAAVGKMDRLDELLKLGRSKGICAVLGLQDQAQVAEIYGPNIAKALSAMVGTHLTCRLAQGETRDYVAGVIGSRRVSITTRGKDGQPDTVHEEMRQIIQPTELTTSLGFRKGRKYGPEKFGIRALLNTGHEDLLLLDWPGIKLPDQRPAFIPAKWTLAKPAADAKPNLALPAAASDSADEPTHHVLLTDAILQQEQQ